MQTIYMKVKTKRWFKKCGLKNVRERWFKKCGHNIKNN